MTFLEIMCTILMGIVILLFLGGGMAIVFWDAIIEMRNSKLWYEGHQELVKVISKEHRYEYKLPYFMMSRDVYYPQYLQYPEEYIVNIECKNGKTYPIKNMKLFESVEINDMIEVWINVGYDKNGEVKNIYVTAEL